MADDPASPLPDAMADCVALYFACDSPEERDGFLRLLAEKPGDEVDAFLIAMLANDEDPFVRVGAARSLAQRGHAGGVAYLREVVSVCSDDDVFAEVAYALADAAGAAAFDDLSAICEDPEREMQERIVAQSALVRADGERAAKAFVDHLEAVQAIGLQLSLVVPMLPALAVAPPLWPRARAALVRLAEQAERTHAGCPRPASVAASAALTLEQERILDAADEAEELASGLRESVELLDVLLEEASAHPSP